MRNLGYLFTIATIVKITPEDIKSLALLACLADGLISLLQPEKVQRMKEVGSSQDVW